MSNIIKADKFKIRIVYLLLIAGLITPSPIFLNFGPFKGNIYYLLILAYVLFSFIKNIRLNRNYIIIIFFFFLFQIFGILYWMELKLFIFQVYFISAFIVASTLNINYFDLFIKISSKFILILLIGATIGFFYTISGGEELFSIVNEDSRSNGFYLSTFSNSYVRGVIRPAGIYDEPGALSFVVCIIAALRKIRGFSEKGTWIILILGFLTFSIAHLIYTFFHFLQSIKNWKFLNIFYLISIFVIIFIIIIQSPYGIFFDEFFFSRLKIIDGQLVGDSRSQLIINSYNFLKDPLVILFGLDVDCIVRPEICQLKGYDQFGDNPLGPLVWGGITLTLPYYSICLYLLYKGIRHFNFIIIGCFLLLMQRVEVMSYGYSMLILILVFTIIENYKKNEYAATLS
jgi:hypothetical protein